ncbi:DUF2269 family protein [Myxococcaceae bacterium GXIMD 01537]
MSVQNLLKLLHLLAVVVFLGDIVVTAVWRLLADRTREPRVIVYALRLMEISDKYLLTPSAMVLGVTGYLRAHLQGIPLGSSPAFVSAQVLFMVSGAVWSLALRPIQARQLVMAESLGASDASFADYLLLTRRWFFWGLVAMLSAFGSMALMVIR